MPTRSGVQEPKDEESKGTDWAFFPCTLNEKYSWEFTVWVVGSPDAYGDDLGKGNDGEYKNCEAGLIGKEEKGQS